MCPLLRRCPLMEVLSIFPLLPTSPFPLFTNSGSKVSYQLLIFDPRKRTLKDRIPMEDIVTIRASCDCFFQIFLSSGKILQFRAENMESQAYWMALIKVGLGRGETMELLTSPPYILVFQRNDLCSFCQFTLVYRFVLNSINGLPGNVRLGFKKLIPVPYIGKQDTEFNKHAITHRFKLLLLLHTCELLPC